MIIIQFEKVCPKNNFVKKCMLKCVCACMLKLGVFFSFAEHNKATYTTNTIAC